MKIEDNGVIAEYIIGDDYIVSGTPDRVRFSTEDGQAVEVSIQLLILAWNAWA